MKKTALKNFATWSRRKLIEQVQTKALLYGIDEKNGLHIEEQFGQLLINEQTYPLSMKNAFTALKKQLEQKGYKQLLEEAAYTWFNRIIAIRYMEVHEYLPERVNVLSSSVGRVDPDILFEYDTMDLKIKYEEVRELVNAGNTEAAYRILFVAQCNRLNRILPFMFEPIQDYTELLLPDFLLDAESVIKTLVQNEELTESFAEIEVIGWLYQYYIAEEKDRVFAQKSKYKKEEIPFATQLFTPKWIVQYMVQNSLGRYWTEAHREDEDLIDNWEYFIKHEEEDFHEKIAPYVNKELKVEDIRLLDPAMGSGHILVYAFEVLYEIYEKCGYPERDIPRLILENNLYGLDIDDRAYQLAAFAVVMKAAQYSRRFLRSVEREGIQLNLASIQETNHISDDVIAYIAQQEVGEQYNQVKAFFDQYQNAKTYGSLINITEREISFIEERFLQIENNPVEDLFFNEQHEIAKQVLPALIHQTKIMRNECDVVATNPPYMGKNGMDKNLSEFLKRDFPNSKSDLFAAFMELNQYLKDNGFYAAINQHAWMFLSSFENLRKTILNYRIIDSMIHLGSNTFDEINGEVVQSCTFVWRNSNLLDKFNGKYYRVLNGKNGNDKENIFKEFLNTDKVYLFKQENFYKIPNVPFAYWASNRIQEVFETAEPFEVVGLPKQGMATCDNNRFLRLWFEVDKNKISFNSMNAQKAVESKKKWFPYNKGGQFRKWSGNFDYVVNWENNGQEIRDFTDILNKEKPGGRIKNEEFYFKKGLTWSTLSSGSISFRYFEEGFLFDTKGSVCFPVEEDNLFYLAGLLNSSVTNEMMKILAPTLDYNPQAIRRLPYIKASEQNKFKVDKLVKRAIELSKLDWDSNELSWDFKLHTLLETKEKSFEKSFEILNEKKLAQIEELKSLEEALNQIIIEIYSLEDEVSYEVDENLISIKHINLKETAKNFLSYFIGCIFGRFGLKANINSKSVLNITEKNYIEEDIIQLLRNFISEVVSLDTVDENIQWLAEALEIKSGEDEESRLRRYFLDEFFADHCKMYQKRPIYWLVDSGKQKGLRTLIYMHRYQLDTMATIRFEHLQEIQAKYQQEIADLENRLVNPNLSATDKKKINAEKLSFEKKIDELREFDKRLAAIATEEIEIDLDDGVKVNYEKFYRGGKGVLAKIK